MLVSVIIPVYKTEKYLERCLDSVLCQDYENIEIICVEDCSPGISGSTCREILQSFRARDNRVKVIFHDSNLGLGGARNTGISAARGKYLASVDSDDVMKPHMVSTLVESAERGGYDIVSCGFDRVDEQEELLQQDLPIEQEYIRTECLDIFRIINPAFWNKLWKRSLFIDNNITFPQYLYYQDAATTPKLVFHAERIGVINESLYSYTVRGESTTTETSDKHILDYLRVYFLLYEFLMEQDIYDVQAAHFKKFIERSIAHHIRHGVSQIDDALESDSYVKQLGAVKLGILKYLENIELYGKP